MSDMTFRRTSLLCIACLLSMITLKAQVYLTGYRQDLIASRWMQGGYWDADWIGVPGQDLRQYAVYHFRKKVSLPQLPSQYVVHVSADNRYKFYVNDSLVALGPCRGDVSNWSYETVDLRPYLHEGENILAAVVWFLADQAPIAQVSGGRMGFLVQGNTDKEAEANTNTTWKCIKNESYAPCHTGRVRGYYAAGPTESVQTARYPLGWTKADFDDSQWPQAVNMEKPAAKGTRDYPYRLLVPRSLPPMEMTFQRMKSVRKAEGITETGNFLKKPVSLQIPAHTEATLLIDQGFETTGYPHLLWTGGRGAGLTLTYAETLFTVHDGIEEPLGDRDIVDNKICFGYEDHIDADGRDFHFTPLWWRTWRYIKLTVKTGDDPLTLRDMYGTFSAYPLQCESQFAASGDADLAKMLEVGWRTARLCANETYMDCPYYEQLQYFGDTRIQAMVTLYNTRDIPLPKQAIEMGRRSMQPDGITASRYPTALPQHISSFSLAWEGIVYDYWMHRGDEAYVRTLLPQIRSVMSWYEQYLRPDGSLDYIPYWFFCDWASNFESGEPIREKNGNSAYQDLLYLKALDEATLLEEAMGLKFMGEHYRELAGRIRKDFRKKYWDEGHKLFADTYDHRNFSQHVNILAILNGIVEGEEARSVCDYMLTDKSITQATISFRYYLFMAMKKAGMGDAYLDQLGIWRQQLKEHMTTWAEMPEPTRSDCHAWGSSPNIDFFRIILGIETDAPGFKKIRIAPSLGKLRDVSGAIPHPTGWVKAAYKYDKKGQLKVHLELPQGTSGTFVWKGREIPLQAGTTDLMPDGQQQRN